MNEKRETFQVNSKTQRDCKSFKLSIHTLCWTYKQLWYIQILKNLENKPMGFVSF